MWRAWSGVGSERGASIKTGFMGETTCFTWMTLAVGWGSPPRISYISWQSRPPADHAYPSSSSQFIPEVAGWGDFYAIESMQNSQFSHALFDGDSRCKTLVDLFMKKHTYKPSIPHFKTGEFEITKMKLFIASICAWKSGWIMKMHPANNEQASEFTGQSTSLKPSKKQFERRFPQRRTLRKREEPEEITQADTEILKELLFY